MGGEIHFSFKIKTYSDSVLVPNWNYYILPSYILKANVWKPILDIKTKSIVYLPIFLSLEENGSFPDLKIIWFIFGIYKQKKLYRSYRDILMLFFVQHVTQQKILLLPRLWKMTKPLNYGEAMSENPKNYTFTQRIMRWRLKRKEEVKCCYSITTTSSLTLAILILIFLIFSLSRDKYLK